MVNNKYIVVQATLENQLILAECGTGRSSITRRWVGQAIGTRPQDVPDFSYGTWAANSYRNAVGAARPILHDVDCILEWPGQGRLRATYERLILPMHDERGRVNALFIASLRNPRIDLRTSSHKSG